MYSVEVSTTKDTDPVDFDSDDETSGTQGVVVTADTVDDLVVTLTSDVVRERTGLTATFVTEKALPLDLNNDDDAEEYRGELDHHHLAGGLHCHRQ